jgi:Icc-related predicted phosphoesterase
MDGACKNKAIRAGVLCIVSPGNDDPLYVDEIIDEFECDYLVNGNSHIVNLDGGIEVISEGYSNPTPWDTPREVPENKLKEMIKSKAAKLKNPDKAIFNIHVPPFNTPIDVAPILDSELLPVMQGGSPLMGHMGSTAVREVIEMYQSCLGLHGHIHESKGYTRIGRSTCFNPGSE